VSVHSRRGVVVSVDEGRGCGVHSGREGGGGAEAARDAAACAASTGAAAEFSEIPQPQRRVDREDFVIICSAIVPDEGRNQKPSEVIRGHQRPSEAIRGHHSVEVSRGQSRVESSYPPPLISRQPSVPRHVTDPECPSSTCCVRPVRKSHTRIEWSRDPVKSTDAPSWAGPPRWPRVRQCTEREWPSRHARRVPDSKSHTPT
jgi:hypothetical protein